MRRAWKRRLDRTWVGMLEYLIRPSLRQGWGGPFNGQRARQAWFEELVRTITFDWIIETGTHRGTTTRYFAEVTGIPVVTIEASARHRGFARLNLLGAQGVKVIAGDSAARLREFLTRVPERSTLFCYLDAHWNDELPLLRELDAIFDRRLSSIVVVDDFRVPGDAGYCFDDYGPSKRLEYPLIAPAVARYGLEVFWPSTPSESETGERRGMVVLTANTSIAGRLERMRALRRQS